MTNSNTVTLIQAASKPLPLAVANVGGGVVGPEPDGSYIAYIDVEASGGTPPYNIAFVWTNGPENTAVGDSDPSIATFEKAFTSAPGSLAGGVMSVTDATGKNVQQYTLV